ncbi:MAG: CHAT domain-containing protein [Planctomycetales bacterium]|nr:CHAT domain-containing protein [Planctomycetales bacterium]
MRQRMPRGVRSNQLLAAFILSALVAHAGADALYAQQMESDGNWIVRFHGAPEKSGNQIVERLEAGKPLRLGRRQAGGWRIDIETGRWIHQNHVARRQDPDTLGATAVPIARVMESPVDALMRAHLLSQLNAVAYGRIVGGRAGDVIQAGPALLGALGANQGPVASMKRVQIHGLLSDAYRVEGDRQQALRHLESAYRLCLAAHSAPPANQNQFSWSMEHAIRMARLGWAETNMGQLKSGEQKLAAATQWLDQLVPADKLKQVLFAAPADFGRAYTEHAEALLKLGLLQTAHVQLEHAERIENQARKIFKQLQFNASGESGWRLFLQGVCEVAGGDHVSALAAFEKAQRQLHSYSNWSGHVRNPNWELVAREETEDYLGEGFHYAISFAARPGGAAPERSFEWVVNRKMMVEEQLRRRMQMMRRGAPVSKPALTLAGSPITRAADFGAHATLDNIQQIRGIAAQFRLRWLSQEDLPYGQLELDALRDVGNALMEMRIGESPDSPAVPWVELPEVQAALPPGTVLLEFLRYRAFDYDALSRRSYRWGEDRYAAWIVPSQGTVAMVDLGPADEVDKAVSRLRSEISAPFVDREQGAEEPAPSEQFRQLLPAIRDLGKLVLDPLRPHLGGAQELVLIPDSQLWLAPWAALEWEPDQFLIEKFALRMVTSGRQLVRAKNADAAAPSSPPLMFADPDFEATPQKILEAEQKWIGAQLVAPTQTPISVAPRGVSLIGRLGAIEATREEARAVRPALHKYCGAAPRVLMGVDALEGALIATRSPRVLVFATHGLHFPNDDPRLSQAPSAIDPMFRSALLLAGAYRVDEWDNCRAADGILTGYEVAALALDGTELVVLSACRSGVGDVPGMEGVLGLRQAFQAAGAKAVLATLWNVPDGDTAAIMARFFDNLSSGEPKSAALRAAQLKQIELWRSRVGAAHPWRWAALTLTE